MANKKISQLTAAGPLTGSEVLPIVQDGVTVKAIVFDVANLSINPFFIPDVIYFPGTSCATVLIDVNGYYPSTFASSKIDAPNLISVPGGVQISGFGNNLTTLTEINFPKLISGNIYIRDWPNLETLNLPLLNQEMSSYPSNFNIFNVNLTSLDFGPLASIPSISINNCNYLTSINLNSLTTTNILSIANNPLITSLDLNSLTTVADNSLDFYNNTSLMSINLSGLTVFDSDFSAYGCALNETTVDSILNQLANVVNLSNRTVQLGGGTNAAPSVTGAGYVATLVSNGCTVTTN